MDAAKTLAEMTVSERRELIDSVAAALEGTAEEAQEQGDTLSAMNSHNLATAIRGHADELSTYDLKSAELLLQQGMSLLAAGLPHIPRSRLH